MTELEIVKRQLLAIRDLVDTTLGILGVAESLDDEHGPCAHPENERIAAGVMGNPARFFCKRCETIVPPDAPPPSSDPALHVET
jgi:hypothetical protein